MKKKYFLLVCILLIISLIYNFYFKNFNNNIYLNNIVAKTNIQMNFDRGGIRYVSDGASYSGDEVRCGDVVRVKECYKEAGINLCVVDKINSKNANAIVYRMKLTNEPNMICPINEERYVSIDAYESGAKVTCGDIVNITNCYIKNGERYCDFDKIKKAGSNIFESEKGVVKRNGLSTSVNPNCSHIVYYHLTQGAINIGCSPTIDADLNVCSYTVKAGETALTPTAENSTLNGRKFIGWAADEDGKNVNCSGKLVTGTSVKINSDSHFYACYEDEKTCQNSQKIVNAKGYHKVKVCYEATKNSKKEIVVKPKSDDFDEILTCANGYTLDAVSKTNVIETTCTTTGDCHKVYELNCVGERPKVIASVGVVQDKVGYINFSGVSKSGIKGYYASRNYLKPTKTSEWIFDSRGKYSLSATPGTMFLWVIDKDDAISYAAMTSVIDKINVDTTLEKLNIKDEYGEVLNTSIYSFNNLDEGIVSSDYVRLSNKLISPVLASGFNPFDTAYKISTKSSKISVYATLTSNDSSYVPGYEPREVELDYGVNTILIKIINKKGKERTYTLIVTREDDRDAINYLKNLSVSEGKLDFSQYKTDYVISVGKNKKSVTIAAYLGSDKSVFVEGFGPREIKLDSNETVAKIKVKSETGSIRVYNLAFIKSGEDTKNNEAMLSSLSLSEAFVAFDKNIFDYNTFVDYEVDSTNIYAIAENGGDVVSIYKNINGDINKIDSKNILLDVGNNYITIIVSTPNGKSKTTTLNIIRKENGLDVSADTALSYLGVNGYDIDFTPEKYDYVVKIKREKSLVIAAAPMSNRSNVYIRGNENLTAFSIVKIRVIAEDGQFREYTIDIKKDVVNKKLEYIAIIGGVVIIVCGIIIIRVRKKRKLIKDYYA